MRLLQARLYLDEDVDVLLATLLTARGYDVEHVSGAQSRGDSDKEQLAYATQSGRVLLTHNRVDFERVAAEWFAEGRGHAGIVIAGRRPVYDLARRVLLLLADTSAVDLTNQIRYV